MAMVDSRMPWLAPRTSRTDLDIDGSNTTLLHSIYGSQVSQLPITEATTSQGSDLDDRCYYSHSTPSLMPRPKSAPPKSFHQKRQRISSARPHAITPAISTNNKRRPMTAVSRGVSQTRSRSRPSTAQPQRRYSLTESIATNNTNSTDERMKEKTVPVALSSTPQYFNFWLEKPLLPKTWDVPMHQRKSRTRPRSDYGIRINRNLKDKSRSAGSLGLGNGTGNDLNNDGKLATLFEVDDSLSSKRNKGRSRNGSGGSDDGNSESCKLGRSDDNNGLDGEGLDDTDMLSNSTLTGNDGNDSNSTKTSFKNYDASSSNKWNAENEDGSDDNKYLKVSGQDGDNDAENDDYFANEQGRGKSSGKGFECMGIIIGSSSAMTRFELPMDLKLLEAMTPVDYLSKHCILSFKKKALYSKVFTQLKPFQNNTISGKDLISKGLIDAHYECITKDQAEMIIQLVGISDDERVSLHLFGAMCAITERVFGPSCIPFHLRKEIIEVVDFEALDWRLRNCTLSDSLKALFEQL